MSAGKLCRRTQLKQSSTARVVLISQVATCATCHMKAERVTGTKFSSSFKKPGPTSDDLYQGVPLTVQCCAGTINQRSKQNAKADTGGDHTSGDMYQGVPSSPRSVSGSLSGSKNTASPKSAAQMWQQNEQQQQQQHQNTLEGLQSRSESQQLHAWQAPCRQQHC